MAKNAKAWASDFIDGMVDKDGNRMPPDTVTTLKAFIGEIGQVAESRGNTLNAVEGAVREQRMKFGALLRHCPMLAGQQFDQLLAEYGKDWQKAENKYRQNLERAKNPPKHQEGKQQHQGKKDWRKPKDRLLSNAQKRRPGGAPSKSPAKVA